jgi:hypothetical protein
MAKKAANAKKAPPKKVTKPAAKVVAKKVESAKEKPAEKTAKKETKPSTVASSKVESPKKVVTVEAPVASLSKAAAKKQAIESTEKIKIDRDAMTDEQVKWAEMYNKYKDMQATNYDMKSSFKAAAPILHKILGWGWIVSNDNDRLEVLFKDGKRVLISNYRG